MGTNYYLKRKPTKKELERAQKKLEKLLCEQIDECDFDDFLKDLSAKVKIHLGKFSNGWQFLWASNPKIYDDNLESIIKTINKKSYEIVNECGKIFTPEQFLEEISENLYYKPEVCRRGDDSTEYVTKDGLRFDKTNDWS